jgi:nucleoside-diphosphate-sugar epimerase
VSGRAAEVERTETKLGDVRDTAADIALARDLIGYHPETALEEGLEAQWRWARDAAVAAGR